MVRTRAFAEGATFDAAGANFSVSFAGQNLPIYPLSSHTNYLVYGLDVSGFSPFSRCCLRGPIGKGSTQSLVRFRLTVGWMDGYAAAMPRKLRLQYPGAMYHVVSRGDRRERIFLDDVDRQDFTKTLAEACQKTAWQVHAYCLMPNHYHLA